VVAPDVVVILDGACEPLDGMRRTSLEQARTPALDALARAGELARVRTVPPGLPAGSEVAIPVLLGWTPAAGVDRGAIEAAAHGIDVPAGARAWRIDVAGDGAAGRAGAAAARRAAQALRTGAPGHAVLHLTGHRLLLVGPSPLPAAAHAPHLRVWPDGIAVPRTLDSRTVVVAARGAGAGVAALLGARVVVPGGATGDAATDLHAKAAAAADALTAGARHVFVHVGGADEAAHARDAPGKVAFLERADRELIGPLSVAVERAGATLRICPDHGCDPATGRHDARPVPCVTWTGGGVAVAGGSRRFTERAAAALPVTDLTTSAAVAA
jgi:2,3-bisphosphoglycerate-independent phosphoglycerate mutase